MSNKQKSNANRSSGPSGASRKRGGLVAGIAAAVVLAGAVMAILAQKNHQSAADSEGARVASTNNNAAAQQKPAAAVEIPTMPINQAVMVTVELDFGPKVPGIADALREVERRSTPDDGHGRTFAILDADGEPTPVD